MTLPHYYWLLCVGVILSMSLYGRKWQTRILPELDMIWVATAVFVFLSCGLLFLYRKRNIYQISHRILIGSFFLLATGGAAVYFKLLVPVETVHFVVFTCFGWLSATVFGFFYGIVAVLSMAIGDEIFQHFLPDRYGDLHDVLINTLSGIAGLFLRNNR